MFLSLAICISHPARSIEIVCETVSIAADEEDAILRGKETTSTPPLEIASLKSADPTRRYAKFSTTSSEWRLREVSEAAAANSGIPGNKRETFQGWPNANDSLCARARTSLVRVNRNLSVSRLSYRPIKFVSFETRPLARPS